MNHHPHDNGFVSGILDRVPLRVSSFVERGYSRLYADQGRQAANQYLLGVCDLMDSKRFLSADDAALRARAEREAGRCRGLTLEAGEAYLAGFGLSLPVAETEAGVLARLACPLWWTRALIRRHDRETEHFSIQVGVVRKGVQAYCSNALLDRVLQRHASAMAMMASWEAVSDEGDTLPLLDVLKGSMANPEVRRAELMVRMRGFEHYAKEQGHVANFYTLTCPSKFHRYSGSALNPHYQNATPKEAQAYLCSVWARIRASLKRDGLNVYGFRVAEPHHDACPHWHLLLFMAPEHADAVTATLQHHALLEDGDEPGAAEHRFKVEAIDLAKGSATGYLAKYISKNIDGFGVGTDEETGEDAGDSARRVRAWASVWGIRQFQQIGGAPVGVWRELRRLDNAPDGLLEDARQAADSGDWAAYLHLQGGADANRKDQPIRIYTMEAVNPETGEVISNRYGEFVNRVKGLALNAIPAIETRIKVWTIQPKAEVRNDKLVMPEPRADYSLMNEVLASVREVFFQAEGRSSPPWSPVNNCTEPAGDDADDYARAERAAIIRESIRSQRQEVTA